MTATEFFDLLWQDYTKITPQAAHIKALFEAQGEDVVNDHVAFRTFSDCAVDLNHLQPLIESMGFQLQDDYQFDSKKLVARSYMHPDHRIPKIFISELERHRLSDNAQKILNGIVLQIPEHSAASVRLLTGTKPWSDVSYQDYQTLLEESEYAGWLACMGLRANHFTVSLNHLNNLADMASVIALLQDNGYALNESGGLVKGVPADLLVQSSTMASRMPMTFAGGESHEVPTCFYEFAQRFEDKHGKLFQGFIAANADKIFESTNS